MSDTTTEGYSTAQRALHWLTAALVVALVTIGLVMSDADPESALRLYLSRAHGILGMTTGVMLIARLILKLRGPKVPPLPMSAARRGLLRAVHAALYVVLFMVLASGASTAIRGEWHSYLWGPASSAPDLHELLPREAHEALVFTLLGLVAVHVIGVFLFEVQHKGALARMLPRRR